MARISPLDEFMDARKRALEGPAARFVVAQGVKSSNGARVNVKPAEVANTEPAVVTRREPAKMNLTPVGPGGMGMQRPPDTNRPEFQVPPSSRPLANTSPEQIRQGIAVQNAMNKVSPMDQFMAAYREKGVTNERPGEKLVMGKTRGMSL